MGSEMCIRDRRRLGQRHREDGRAVVADRIHADVQLREPRRVWQRLGEGRRAGVADRVVPRLQVEDRRAGALEANTRLWVLSLEQNSIGEKGALALARAITVGARNIFELGLSLNPIPEKGARKLMAVLDDRATALRRLALPRNGREGLHAPSWECVGGCPQGHQAAVLDLSLIHI